MLVPAVLGSEAFSQWGLPVPPRLEQLRVLLLLPPLGSPRPPLPAWVLHLRRWPPARRPLPSATRPLLAWWAPACGGTSVVDAPWQGLCSFLRLLPAGRCCSLLLLPGGSLLVLGQRGSGAGADPRATSCSAQLVLCHVPSPPWWLLPALANPKRCPPPAPSPAGLRGLWARCGGLWLDVALPAGHCGCQMAAPP